jgi:hypothetical protein
VITINVDLGDGETDSETRETEQSAMEWIEGMTLIEIRDNETLDHYLKRVNEYMASRKISYWRE